MLAAGAGAGDGVVLKRNIPQTPLLESNFAELELLDFYVPAQAADGTVLRDTPQGGIVYRFEDDLYLPFTREFARPLFTFYTDGHVEKVELAEGFGGHGTRDAFAALSLDDGHTWVHSNLSQSAGTSSIDIDGVPYPGDVIYLSTASAGNHVLAVWASRFCDGGTPNYAIDLGTPAGSTPERDALIQAAVEGLYRLPVECTDASATTHCLYYDDLFGVGGDQKSSDFGDVGYPEVGIVPYSCLWAARGTIEPVRILPNGDRVYDPGSEQHGIVWRQPERLTSGVRDVHRIEARGVSGAGFVVTWQEDPNGLYPGCGLGPGLGWSGASAHQETDIWYAYLPAEAFALVEDGDGLFGDPVTLAEYFATESATPPVGIPMSIPVRLTDNARCRAGAQPDPPYCSTDFDGSGVADFCAGLVEVESEYGPVTVCLSEDGRLMRGNTSSTRARINLYGYDADGNGLTESAWVVVAAEEKKGLGSDELGNKIDMGKNVFYYTFDMSDPEVVSQGLMLNPPASYPDWAKTAIGDATALVWERNLLGRDESEWFARIVPDPIYGPASLTTELYQTEIARRFDLIAQPTSEVGPSGTVALATYKEGIIHQGGPADIMARRIVLPSDFDPRADNPFDYANMKCDDWAYTDGSNPRYLKGLCKSPAINLSGTTIVTCTDLAGVDGAGPEECAASFPWNDRFDDYDLSDTGVYVAKLTTWRTCQEGVELAGATCTDNDLDDPSWSNPFDLAKGHRGFMDGDFIMVAYTWTPNWAFNKVGQDSLDLYARRSFDGGRTWTTTPATLGGEGTAHCETYRDAPYPSLPNTTICYPHGPGEFEQPRNLSRVPSVELTVLDPRAAPTFGDTHQADGSLLYPEDERDHSKFVLSYEIGDNTTVLDSEAEALDMFYGRATRWGDFYELFEQPEPSAPLIECPPERLLDPANTCRFDGLELTPELHSAEAATAVNSAGSRFYAHWSEWEKDEVGEVIASDTSFRRILWFLDEAGMTEDGIDRVYDLSVDVAGLGTGYVQGDYLGERIIDCGSGGRALCHRRLAEDLVCDLWPYEGPDSYFDRWQGDLVSTEDPLQLAMTRDWSLSAFFEPWPLCDPLHPDLVLAGMTCTEVDLIVACNSILVQGNSVVTETGDLTLRAGDWVGIANGFVLEEGGQMEIVVRPYTEVH